MSAINKTILREIRGTFGRFISILLLIAIGVFAYVGISVTGDDMRLTGIDYSNKQNLADIYIQSTYGLDAKDQEALANFPELTQIEYGYSADVTMVKRGADTRNVDNQLTIKVESLTTSLSQYDVISGKLPQKEDEIILDDLLSPKFSIGDEVAFVTVNKDDTSLDNLERVSYKVVGFANSPEFFTRLERGQSLSGKGEIRGFAGIMAWFPSWKGCVPV